MIMITLHQISKDFSGPRGTVKALSDIDLHIQKNEFVVIRGPSGSGKTTLLLTIGGMLCPTSGRLTVGSRDIYALNNHHRARFRGEEIGFVFQLFHLVPYLSLLENVQLPLGILPGERHKDEEQARFLLNRLHLGERLDFFPSEVSAGEKQRAAIARAVIRKPAVVLADEPTGNLDPQNAAEIAGCLADIHQEGGTVIVVTHGLDCDPYADRIIHLDQGRVISP